MKLKNLIALFEPTAARGTASCAETRKPKAAGTTISSQLVVFAFVGGRDFLSADP
jgi:hypothetical protein